ncbi:cyclin-O [Brachionichthys hirsutus]|uniref:cyclin-O n=1 Tax=Brachionichthys hirsutus TaxID=412623 RepID=UPI00360508D8
MVTFANGDCGLGTLYKRRRTSNSAIPATPVRRRQAARRRKQVLMSKISDSGFEDDLGSSPISSAVRIDASPRRPGEPPAGPLSTWYLQYGDVGYQIQREKEAHYHPCRSLARQPQLTADARCTLVSWLIPVHKHFRLSFECCCLAVNIMDRFLASTPVATDCFQLLGVTALLLASKQVEVCSPRICTLLSFCCDAFTREQLCNLECVILLRLNFCLDTPTLAFFLDYYTNCNGAAQVASEDAGGNGLGQTVPGANTPGQCSNFAQKVCELSLADYSFNKYPPSLTAACALWVARDLLETEHGLVGQTTLRSKEDMWDSFVDELCIRPASAQSSGNHEQSDVNALSSVKGHFLSTREETYSLAQECKDNLKLLVSLNQEILISNM